MDEYDYLFEDSKTLLTGPELEFFEQYGQALHREAGHRFIEQDEKTDFMLLIRKGHVIVWNPALRRIQAIRGEGEVVGETAAIAGMPRSATIEALDSVEVLRLSGRRYRQFLGEHPRAAISLLRAVYERLSEADQQAADSSELAAEQRLAKTFVRLIESGFAKPSARGLVVKLSQDGIRAFNGGSLASVKKIIRTFKEHGIVATSRQATIILDPGALREIAKGDRTALD